MAYGNYAPFYRTGYFNPIQPQPMPNMAENQGQYVSQYQQPISNQQLQNMQHPTPTNDMIWTQGEAGAKGYLVAPNNTVVLWDTESPTIYVKSADASGVPSMRVLDFTERNTDTPISQINTPKTHECKCGDKFVTIEEFNALKGKFYDLQARYDELILEEKEKVVEKPKTATKKTKESEE